jgi:voltage-dependent calcium channel L type alpha-1D
VSSLRTFRVLRPLRTLTRFEGMRVVVQSIFASIPALFNVFLLCAFIFLVFGIVGVQLWSGILHGRCYVQDPEGALEMHPDEIICGLSCPQDPNLSCVPSFGIPCPSLETLWANASAGNASTVVTMPGTCRPFGGPSYGSIGFDNIGQASITIFTSITLEGWVDVMYAVSRAWGLSFAVVLYFIFLIMLGSFFLLNLALAVIWDEYESVMHARTRLEQELIDDLTAELKAEIRSLRAAPKLLLSSSDAASPMQSVKSSLPASSITDDSPVKLHGLPSSLSPPVRLTSLQQLPSPFETTHSQRMRMRPLERLAKSPSLEIAIAILIVLNTVALALEFHGMSKDLTVALDIMNYIFSSLFTIEVCIKIIGLGVKQYFRSAFNVFDSVVVLMSLLEIILALTSTEAASGLSALRTFRLLRIFKLAKTWKDLQKLLVTIARSVAEVATASVVLLIIMFIFVLMGMQLFGGQLGAEKFDGSPPRANFDNLWWAFVTVFQVLTGENWNEVLFASVHATGAVATVYFVALNVVGNYLILNLFLAILLGNFERASEDEVTAETLAATKAPESGESGGLPELASPPASSPVPRRPEPKTVAPKRQEMIDDSTAQAKTPSSSAASVMSPSTPSQKQSRPEMSMSQLAPAPASAPAPGSLSKGESVVDLTLVYGKRSQGSSFMTTTLQDPTGRLLSVQISRSGDVQVNHPQTLNRPPTLPRVGSRWPVDYSLYLFPASGAFRRFCYAVVKHPWFDQTILFLIAFSSILLAVDEPRISTCSALPAADPLNCIGLATFLYIADFALTILFSLEMLLKIVALGFALHPNSYLRSGWNVLDGFIVVVSVVSLALGGSSSLKALRSLRALRALRPLRVVSRYPSLKLVVNSIFGALPKVSNVGLVNFLFFLIFAIVGVQNFMGALGSCNDPTVSDKLGCTGMFNTTGELCGFQPTTALQEQCQLLPDGLPFPRTWAPPPAHFDNVLNGLLTVFEVATGEMWPDIMYTCVDAVGVDQPQQENYQPAAALYFVLIQIVCSFFMLEVFTGVIIDNFNKLKSDSKGSVLLTASQQNLVESLKVLLTTRPKRLSKPPPPRSSCFSVRRTCFVIAESQVFEMCIMGVIAMNTVFMAARFYGQSLTWEGALNVANLVFNIVFTVEAVIKIVGLGPRQYLSSGWNCFDASLVIGGWAGIAFEFGAIATLLRIFRVARIFRLLRTSKGLMQLLRTLIVSLPSLFNVGALLLLLFFIYACVGMNLLSDLKHGDFINEDANFESFGTAMLTLFRVSTGESYNGIMHDAMVQPPFCDPGTNCGDVVIAPLYFISFFILSSFILLNLLVAIILDNYEDTKNADDCKMGFRLTASMKEHYRDMWALFDSKGTGLIGFTELVQLVCVLKFPLGLRDHPGVRPHMRNKALAQRVLSDMDVPSVSGDRYEFQIVLQALVNNATASGEWRKTRVSAAPKLEVKGQLKIIGGLKQTVAIRKIQHTVRQFLAQRRRVHKFIESNGRKPTPSEMALLRRTGTRVIDRQLAMLLFATGAADAAKVRITDANVAAPSG